MKHVLPNSRVGGPVRADAPTGTDEVDFDPTVSALRSWERPGLDLPKLLFETLHPTRPRLTVQPMSIFEVGQLVRRKSDAVKGYDDGVGVVVSVQTGNHSPHLCVVTVQWSPSAGSARSGPVTYRAQYYDNELAQPLFDPTPKPRAPTHQDSDERMAAVLADAKSRGFEVGKRVREARQVEPTSIVGTVERIHVVGRNNVADFVVQVVWDARTNSRTHYWPHELVPDSPRPFGGCVVAMALGTGTESGTESAPTVPPAHYPPPPSFYALWRTIWESDPEVKKFLIDRSEIDGAHDASMDERSRKRNRTVAIAWHRREPVGSVERAEELALRIFNNWPT